MKKLITVLILFCLAAPVVAFETDQYNLPPQPLADIGDEVAAYVRENVAKAIAKCNAKIDAAKTDEERAEWRSDDAVAKEVFKLLGDGFPPFTNSGTWMEKHEFRAQPARWKTSWGDSIYRTAPLNLLTISPTVKIYGASFGTDKIAHIYQQGYTYYKTVAKNRRKDKSEAESVAKAIAWGKLSEKSFYGFWVSAVWSNADLAANLAGYKFYLNLTREVRIGDSTLAPLATLREGRWALRDGVADAEFLRPFVSDHFNEALNPSIYINILGFRNVVRGTVDKKACPQWRAAFPSATKQEFTSLTSSLELWHGEDYGFRHSEKRITIDRCFNATAAAPRSAITD